MSGPESPGRPASERSADLRVARLHLRGGTHALARAELEALAGSDDLDREGILDLAEVRWRTGDLAGAAVAAAAWLEEGEEAGAPGALAHVISAEAAVARGALEAATAHVEAAMGRIGDARSLDTILAGVATSAAWPREDEVVGAAPAQTSPPARPAPGPASTPARAGGAPMSPPAAELVEAGAVLLRDAPGRATVLLALAVRADRAAVKAVLELLDAAEPDLAHAAAFAFLRAEALQAAGRHDESRIAYASAHRLALTPAEAGTPGSPQ